MFYRTNFYQSCARLLGRLNPKPNGFGDIYDANMYINTLGNRSNASFSHLYDCTSYAFKEVLARRAVFLGRLARGPDTVFL